MLVVSNLYPPVVRGGYEAECRDVVQHLRNEHEVTVLTSDEGLPVQDPHDGVLRVLPPLPDHWRSRLRAPAATARAQRIVRDLLATDRPDLVFVWNGSQIPQAAILEFHRAGVPVAYRVCQQWFGALGAGGDFFLSALWQEQPGPAHRAWAAAVRLTNLLPGLRVRPVVQTEAAICWNSEFLRGAVPVPAWITPVCERTVLPATEAADALASVEHRPAGPPPTVLFVGRLTREKGLDVAIRAVALLRERGVEVTLRVVGHEAGRRGVLEALAAELGIGDQVSFAGPMPPEQLRDEIAAASAWVVPSVWDEPAGMVVTEAGLAQVPVVASRVGGIPEILREPTEILMFDRGDAAGCAAALATTLAGGPEVEERVQRAHERARSLSFVPYLEAIDAFLGEAAAALGVVDRAAGC
jgi:glycosyltransferase involved in cell wall biosynthesis